MDISEYYEKVSAGKFLRAIVFTVLLLTGLIILTIWLSLPSTSLLFTTVITLSIVFVVLIAVVTLLNFSVLKITITSKELVVDFGRFNHQRFLLQEIESCEQTKTGLKKYLGVGIRYGADNSIAYSVSFGRAVKITQKGGRPFVFSTNHPDKICQIISTKKQTTS